MFLSVATTHRPATDLGYLLHKHPDRLYQVDLGFGTASVVFPEAGEARCEAALVVDIDPVGLVRGRGDSDGLLDRYVNDRPYAASSFLSVAMARALRTAMTGTSRERPDLAAADIPLEATVTPLPTRDETLVRSLFEPLGWTVAIEALGPELGPAFAGGPGYVALHLSGTARLASLLVQLYVLLPVLDDEKHYWIGDDEVEKLIARGEGWLPAHPARDLIVRRYLGHRRRLADAALARLAPETADEPIDDEAEEARPEPEAAIEAPIRLHDLRLDTVVAELKAAHVRSVADLGCGAGKLLMRLVREASITRLVGLDASSRDLERARRRLKLDADPARAERIVLVHGALTYRDSRWAGVEAAALVEVIEHLDPDRLPALERVVFGEAKPRLVVVTTPNADYNVLFPTLPAGARRHPDHRFEWSRAEGSAWAEAVAERYGYALTISGIGLADPWRGAPSQLLVFRR